MAKTKQINLADEVLDTLQLYASCMRNSALVGEMLVATVCGTLRVTPFDDWIALQFKDLELVRNLPGGEYNEISGKWNIHVYNGMKADRAAVLREFNRRMEKIGCRIGD